MDPLPQPYEVLKPFSIYHPLLHSHLLHSTSLFFVRFPFIRVSFAAFLSDFLWISTVSLLLHFCFGVVWIAPALCFEVYCLRDEFESSSSP